MVEEGESGSQRASQDFGHPRASIKVKELKHMSNDTKRPLGRMGANLSTNDDIADQRACYGHGWNVLESYGVMSKLENLLVHRCVSSSWLNRRAREGRLTS